VSFQDHNVDDFPSKMLKALGNMKIKLPGRNQTDADSIYQQVRQQTISLPAYAVAENCRFLNARQL